MEAKEYGIVLFNTTQAAIKAEKVLNEAGIKTKLIPVPRYISSNCGVSLMFDLKIMSAVKSALNKGRVPIEQIRSLS